jgi:hypothetical protein
VKTGLARKFRTKKNLSLGGETVWSELTREIQDACETFKELVPRLAGSVDCSHQNGRRFHVRIDRPYMLVVVVLSFDGSTIQITYAPASLHSPRLYQIGADDQSAFIGKNGERMSYDQISEEVLNPVFLPVEQNSVYRRDSLA